MSRNGLFVRRTAFELIWEAHFVVTVFFTYIKTTDYLCILQIVVLGYRYCGFSYNVVMSVIIKKCRKFIQLYTTIPIVLYNKFCLLAYLI